jgi:cytidine deaminase
VSASPFQADPVTAERIARLEETVGDAVTARLSEALVEGHILPGAVVDELIETFGLTGPRDVVLLALPAATRLASPPISGFFVGAVGLEAGTGDLILGGNVEFPGTDLAATIHGEGFVAARTFARDSAITVLSTGEARPCGHCRQTLSEYAWSRGLALIDRLGHTLSLAELYPWPFVPGDLGEPGVVGGAVPWPDLRIADDDVPADIADLLVRTGRRSHAPYSHCPAAIVVRLHDGRLVAGAVIESVAFDPTIGPLQAALIELLAHGHAYAAIESATLAVMRAGDADLTHATRALLSAVAPGASLTVTSWA